MATLVSTLGSFVVTFLSTVILGWLSDSRAASAQKEIGQLTAERDQARAGESKQKQLAAEAAKHVDEDDAIDMMERGQG